MRAGFTAIAAVPMPVSAADADPDTHADPAADANAHDHHISANVPRNAADAHRLRIT
jgi:hypothetical protein